MDVIGYISYLFFVTTLKHAYPYYLYQYAIALHIKKACLHHKNYQ